METALADKLKKISTTINVKNRYLTVIKYLLHQSRLKHSLETVPPEFITCCIWDYTNAKHSLNIDFNYT